MVRVVQFVPELCAPCASLALDTPAPGRLLGEVCAPCRQKISEAAERFADAVAAEKAATERKKIPITRRERRT